MDNLFNNMFPITKPKKPDKETIENLVAENNKLKQSLKSEHVYNVKHRKIISVLTKRVEEQKELLDKMDKILKSQNEALLRAKSAMDTQTKQIEHYERIVARMQEIKQDQAEIIRYTNLYGQGMA